MWKQNLQFKLQNNNLDQFLVWWKLWFPYTEKKMYINHKFCLHPFTAVYLLVRNNPLAWMTIWSTIFSSSKPWSCLSAAAALKQCILSVCYLPDCANCFIRLLSWSAVLQDDHLHSFYGRWEWGLAKLPNVLKVKWLVNLLIPCKHHRAGG